LRAATSPFRTRWRPWPWWTRVDPLAQRIGAINTIVVKPDGTLAGYNNDAYGFIQSLLDAQPGCRADAGPITVLGAGGGARATLVALAERGAQDIRLCNRSLDKAQTLAAELGGPIRAYLWSNAPRRWRAAPVGEYHEPGHEGAGAAGSAAGAPARPCPRFRHHLRANGDAAACCRPHNSEE
jgi:hypothetical protein